MTQQYQPFPVIAIGASAAGSAPIIELIRALPATIPAAVVIVQPLAQQRDSGLAALLAKATVIPVLEISDGLRLHPGHIHIFPPDRELELEQGVFRLSAGSARDPHFFIDRFFQSLAREQKRYAIGVLLPGTGSDGALGLGAIKKVFALLQQRSGNDFSGYKRSSVQLRIQRRMLRKHIDDFSEYLHHL